MSERKWTKAQLEAIESKEKNLILSAAAGSGKTATLTERIIRLLKDSESSADLSRMLIVTFTTAAAGELKERIAAALSAAIEKDPKNSALARQLASLEGAHISTIDSFFKSSIRSYSKITNLPPDFSILDEAEAAVLRSQAMAQTVFAHFEGRGYADKKAFSLFADIISTARNEADLCSSLMNICSDLKAYDIGKERLASLACDLRERCDDFFATEYCDVLKASLLRTGKHFEARFSYLANALSVDPDTEKYVPEAERLQLLAKELADLPNGTYCSAADFFAAIDFPRLPPIKRGKQSDDYDLFKSLRNELKGEILSFKNDFFSQDEKAISESILKTADHIETLSKVCRFFDDTYGKEKADRGVADFQDLSEMARKIFVNPDGSPTEAAIETGKKFDYIFIDEYQDTNPVQDDIFSAISCHSGRFMVGDVKQSIYGFRGSRPELFTAYRKKYESGEEGCAVFMSENFRSDRCVIDFSNMISRYIFSAGSTPFEREDELVCSKAGGESKNICEVILVEARPDGAEDDEEAQPPSEPECVAARISELIATEKLSDESPIRPKDIAILLRSGTNADEYVRCLARRGIPANNSASEEFFSYSEVLLVLCLLNTADNPLRDIYLAGAMKSPLFNFTLNDLVNIRIKTDAPLWYSLTKYCDSGTDDALRQKCISFRETVNRWRAAARELSADEMLRLIVADTDLRSYGGDGIRKNSDVIRSLKVISDQASAVAKRGGTLSDLIAHINSAMERKDKTASFADPDSVSILTVHKSKGLEYPICFFSEASKRFDTRDTSEKLLVDRSGRIGMKLYDDGGLVRCDNPMRRAVAMQMSEDSLEEEARILYVAMTRARERLIVSCKVKNATEKLEKAEAETLFPLDNYEVFSASSCGDWLIRALKRYGPSQCFIYKKGAEIKGAVFENTRGFSDINKDLLSFFEKSLDFSYDKEYLWNIPAKLSVSVLKPDILDGDEEKAYFDSPKVISMPESAPLPAFLSDKKEADGAARGTATHLFMQFCNFERLCSEGVESELERLIEKQFISRDDASLVRTDEIELFRKSDIFKSLLSAESIMRERRFNTLLPAKDFTTDPALQKQLENDGITITVQGVVDCIFTDSRGRAVLVDYKTDRLSKEELADENKAKEKLLSRHARQLNIYRYVCEKMIGRPFDSVLIYSLPLGKAIEVI